MLSSDYRRGRMADVLRLFQAAIQAVEAGAQDLAIDFAQRAIKELNGAGGSASLPWKARHRWDNFEFLRRAIPFLGAFAAAPGAQVPEERARELAREFFPEEPRAVGPSFYRPEFLQAVETPSGRAVRLTEKGQRALKVFAPRLAQLEEKERRTAAVY
jgi:hypothetical protein